MCHSFFAKRRIRFSAIFLRSLTCLSCVRNCSQNGGFSIGMDLPDSMGAHTQRIPQFTPMDGREIDPFMGVKDRNPWEKMPKDSEKSLPRSDSARPARPENQPMARKSTLDRPAEGLCSAFDVSEVPHAMMRTEREGASHQILPLLSASKRRGCFAFCCFLHACFFVRRRAGQCRSGFRSRSCHDHRRNEHRE